MKKVILFLLIAIATQAQVINGGSTGSGGTTINPTNGVPPTRSSATAFRDSTSADIIALFTTCSGTQYLGADGICHTASGAPAGSQSEVQYRNAGSFGAITNSAVDVSADASAANRSLIALNPTWTAGSSSFSVKTLEIGCTAASATSINTLACGYFTLQNKNTAGVMGHPLGLAIRFSDNSTGSATISTSLDGIYIEANNTAGSTGVGTIPEVNDINLANGALDSTSRTISLFNGLKYTAPSPGANTIITRELGLNMGPIRGTTAQIPTSHLINTGGCTHANVYLPFIACGGLSEFQGPVLITGMTMDGTTSAVPQTVTQPYIMKFNNFHSAGTTAQVNMLLTTANGASGTTVGLKNIVDIGGSSGTITLASAFQGQIVASGGATGTKSIVYDILASSATGPVTTAIGYHAAAIKGVNITTGYGVWTEGTSDFNRFDGQVGIHKIPTTTSTLAIAGLPTSSAGLVTGDVWANANVLTIVP